MSTIIEQLKEMYRPLGMEKERSHENMKKEELLIRQQQLLQAKEERIKELQAALDDQKEANKRLQELVDSLSSSDQITGGMNTIKNELKGSLNYTKEELNENIYALRTELAEKVHMENVKSYRNVQGLIEELERKMEALDIKEESVKKLQGLPRAALFFGIFNFLLLAGYILYEFGIIAYLMTLI